MNLHITIKISSVKSTLHKKLESDVMIKMNLNEQSEDHNQNQLRVLDLSVENQLMRQVVVLLNTYIERSYQLLNVEFLHHDH